jgi:hypothetical protein
MSKRFGSSFRVECYLALRCGIGYTVRYEAKLLKDFVRSMASQDVRSLIRAQMAVDWVSRQPLVGERLLDE